MHSDNPSKNIEKFILKDEKLAGCLVVSSHVLTLKRKSKHAYMTQKRLFVCIVKQLIEPLLGEAQYESNF